MAAGFVRANGVSFAVQQSGPRDAPLALLVHGFPDTPSTWRHLTPLLVGAGYRVAAPWLRGYAPSEVPADRTVEPDTLAADLNALHRALGGDRDAVLVGHDWGAIAAARAAAAAPQRWRRLATLAVPPERVLARHLGPTQLWRSRYLVAAQLPGAEQRMLHPASVAALWRRWSPGYVPSDEDLEPVAACFRSPGVPRAVLAYYRGFRRAAAAGRALSERVPLPPQPHLVLHGRDDGCIGAEVADATVGRLPHPASEVVVLDGVGHFLHLEAPDEVGARIVAHLGAAKGGA
ncbi:alpha/beta hydrolase [Nitriliruptoraceae bacterium ZYF776]|nr:alpha/beta hydrolase [Profundirhabdus halotolerans]